MLKFYEFPLRPNSSVQTSNMSTLVLILSTELQFKISMPYFCNLSMQITFVDSYDLRKRYERKTDKLIMSSLTTKMIDDFIIEINSQFLLHQRFLDNIREHSKDT